MRLNVGASLQRAQPLLRRLRKARRILQQRAKSLRRGGDKRPGGYKGGGQYGTAVDIGRMEDADTNVGAHGGY